MSGYEIGQTVTFKDVVANIEGEGIISTFIEILSAPFALVKCGDGRTFTFHCNSISRIKDS